MRDHAGVRAPRAGLVERGQIDSRPSLESVLALFRAAPTVFYTAGTTGQFGVTFITSYVTELTGYTPDQFTSPDFWADHIHPEDTPRVLDDFSRLTETGTLVTEYRFRFSDGSYHWMHDIARLTRDPQTGTACIVGHWEDVTKARANFRALQQLHERLLRAETVARFGSWELDPPGGPGWWSPEMFVLFGRNPALGPPTFEEFLEQVHPADRPRIQQAHATSGRTGEPARLRFRTDPARAPVRALDATVHSELNAQGQVVKFSGTVLDVTEREQVLEALRVSEGRHRMVAEMTSDFVFVARAAGAGGLAVEWVSGSLEKALGYSVEEFKALSNPFALVHPGDLAAAREARERVLRGEARVLELRILDKGGDICWIRAYARPLWDPSVSRVIGLYGAAQNITARKRAELALRCSEQRLRSLVEHAWDGVALLSARGTIEFVTSAASRILGFTPEQLVGLHFLSLVHADDAGRVSDRFAHIVSMAGYSEVVSLRMRHRDGEWRWVEGKGTNLLSEPSVHAIIVNFREITDRVHADEERRVLLRQLLHAQDEERRRIARDLHDSTAQKLAALMMTLGTIERLAGSSDRVQQLLADCLGLAHECSEDLRTVSYVLHPPLLDELGLVSALGAFCEGFSQRSGVAVTFDAPDDLGQIPGAVEVALFRIVQEALGNIRRHSGSRTADVRLSRDGAAVIMTVKDEGHGIAAEKLEALTGGAEMPGVGLASMRGRMQQLGGRLEVESSDAGFTIRAVVPVE